MNLKARRPELEGYAEVVKAAKREGTVIEPGAFWLLLLGFGLLWFSSAVRDWSLMAWSSGITFSMAIIFIFAAIMLSFNIIAYPDVAKRLGIAKTKLAEHMGWTWEAVETNKAGYPLTPGRLKGQAAGIGFVMETTKSQRELRFDLPERDLTEPFARDFYDLQEVERERERRNSLAGLPGKAGILSGPVGKALGRDRSASLEGNTLCIRCTPYKETGLSPDANIKRRMREAEAILTLAEAIRNDWLADFDLS